MKYYGNDKLMIPFFIYEAWKKLLNPPRNHLKKKKNWGKWVWQNFGCLYKY